MNSISETRKLPDFLEAFAKKVESMTPEERAEEEARIIAIEAEKTDEAIREGWQKRGVTERYMKENWDTFRADSPELAEAVATVRQKAGRENLYICGPSGTGKTHIAMSLAKDGGIYKRLPDIFREVRLDFKKEQEIIDLYGSVRLLIIDEVGRQKFSDFEKNLFFEIVDKRWNNVKTTILVTNLNAKEFAEEYGTAIVDRLRPVRVEFSGSSKRGAK